MLAMDCYQLNHQHIHMNGRIYDPTLGRFLQADPLIQAPTDSQSYNRYAYVRNNPLTLTDPSGYSWISKAWKKVKPFIGAIAAVVVSIYCQVCGATMWNAAMTGAAIGAGSAAINGGNILKGAFTGALAGAAFQQIGASFNGAEGSGFFAEGGLGHIVTHGATGGVMSVLQGGKFGHGFLSAGLTKAMNINSIVGTAAKDAGLRVALAAVVGGTISKITGGKFANGAITAAFAQAFNGEQQAERQQAWKDFRAKYGAIVDAGNIDITKNIAEASNMGIEEFVDAVKTGGKWDYKNPAKYGHLVKQFGSDLMDDFGNVHFGMVAAASQHTLAVSLWGAGQYQAWRQSGGNHFQALVSNIGYGLLSNSSARNLTNSGWTWGDNPGDSLSIMRGHDYTSKIYGCFGASCE